MAAERGSSWFPPAPKPAHFLTCYQLEYWQKIAASILEIFTSSTYKDIAPYVFHSVEFGTEPIGDMDDGDNFIDDLIDFKTAIQPYGIPVGISEDWDRPGIMRANETGGLGPIGEQILPESDFVHAHVMPYYHGYNQSDAWSYIESQVWWYKNNTPVPTIISEVSSFCPGVAPESQTNLDPYHRPNGHGNSMYCIREAKTSVRRSTLRSGKRTTPNARSSRRPTSAGSCMRGNGKGPSTW